MQGCSHRIRPGTVMGLVQNRLENLLMVHRVIVDIIDRFGCNAEIWQLCNKSQLRSRFVTGFVKGEGVKDGQNKVTYFMDDA